MVRTVLCAVAGLSAAAAGQTWDETVNGGGDAGDLPASAQVCAGSGPLTVITGTNGAADADVYAILITDPATFTASTLGVTTWDTMLWLFDASGHGVTANDDHEGKSYQSKLTGQFVFSPGLYYLVISHFYNAPTDAYPVAMWFTYSPEARPDGGGQLYPIAGWEGGEGDGGAYQIDLTGAALVPPGGEGACCLANGFCATVSAGACAALGGVFNAGASCASTPCAHPPSGACCLPNMTCQVMSQAYCAFLGGAYKGTGTTCAAAGCTLGWVEQNDAGGLINTAQQPLGSGDLPGISGTLLDIKDEDTYRIRICNAAAFRATTMNIATTFDDTALFLFNPAGFGLAFNDDDPSLTGYRSTLTPQFVPGNGIYYLTISSWDEDALGAATVDEIWLDGPYNVERQPDGPAAGEPLGFWDTQGYYAGRYLIQLSGVCFEDSCYPDCNADGALTVADFGCFQTKFVAGDPYADCNQDGALTVADFGCFQTRFVAGCP